MTDLRALPDDHPLKPLETRMLEMAADAGPMRIWVGNCIAALRVFAAHHPGIVDESLPPSTATASHDEDTVLARLKQ